MEPKKAGRAGRAVLPFVRPEPAPVQKWALPFGVRATPVQFVAGLWRDEDLPSAPHAEAAIADPCRPGYSWILRLIDLATGEVCLPLTPEQVEAWPRPEEEGPAPLRRLRS